MVLQSGWIGWSPGGVRYRPPHGANKDTNANANIPTKTNTKENTNTHTNVNTNYCHFQINR